MSETHPTTDERSAHTPGPWETTGKPYIETSTGEGAMFSQGDWYVYPPLGQSGPIAVFSSETDARLGAAAPELLEIVRDLVEYGGGMEYDTYIGLVRRASEALAKAEGRS